MTVRRVGPCFDSRPHRWDGLAHVPGVHCLRCGHSLAELWGAHPVLPMPDRFWTKVDRRGPDECWPWLGLTGTFGYGRFTLDRHGIAAHRMAWILANGPIPDGLNACHKCDNPPCVNPAHLFLGTHNDNAQDRIRKGRSVYVHSERNGLAKLTSDQVREIRRRHAPGDKANGTYPLAREFGVAPATIWQLMKGRSWRHVQ